MNDWIWSNITSDELQKLVDLGKSTKEIAQLYNVSYWTVYKKAKIWNIKIPKYYYHSPNKRVYTKKEKPTSKLSEEILEKYIKDGLKVKEIANELKVDISYVYRYCREHNIQFNKAIIPKVIDTYICVDCQKEFHSSNWLPYCNNCGIKHYKINNDNFLKTESNLGKLIQDLRNQGLSYLQISKDLGCSKSTVAYYCNESIKDLSSKKSHNYKKTWVGKFISRLDAYKHRKFNPNKVFMCQDWNKKFRTQISKFKHRYKHRGNIIEHYSYMRALDYFGGTKTKCYLTGHEINIETDDYQLDHIVPVSKGGDNKLTNMGIVVPAVNKMKSDLTVEELFYWCKEILQYNGYKVEKLE